MSTVPVRPCLAHQILVSKSQPLRRQSFGVALLLLRADLRQKWPQDLAVCDRTLAYAGVPDEPSGWERHAFVLADDVTVVALAPDNLPARRSSRERTRLEQVHDPLVVEGQVLGDVAFFLPGKDPIELLVRQQRAVCIVGTLGHACKAPTDVRVEQGTTWRSEGEPHRPPPGVQTRRHAEANPEAAKSSSAALEGVDDHDAEDTAYLHWISLVRAGRREAARAAGLDYLRRFPNGFRHWEVERAMRPTLGGSHHHDRYE